MRLAFPPRPTSPVVQAPRRVYPAARLAVLLGASVALATACRSSHDGTGAGASGAAAKEGARATAVANGAVANGAVAGGDADTIALRARADSNRILGSPQAKVWMLIVSDFQCPYCKMWHDQ